MADLCADEEILNLNVNEEERVLIQRVKLSPEYFEIQKEIQQLLPDDIHSPFMLLNKNVTGGAPVMLYQNDRINVIFKSDNDYYYSEADKDFEPSFNPVLHEIIIGIFGTNTLNSPNFARVLAGNYPFPCPRYLARTSDLCQSEYSRCAYVVYEYIPGPTMLVWLGIASYSENSELTTTLLKILRDIFYALYDAYRKIDFTHYDLHPGNIIIQSGNVPVIIDFGTSHINYRGINYGLTFCEAEIYNRSMWVHDVFKLLMFVYWSLYPEFINNRLIAHINEIKLQLESADTQPSDKEHLNRLLRYTQAKEKKSLGRITVLGPKIVSDILSFFFYGRPPLPDDISGYHDYISDVFNPSKSIQSQHLKFENFLQHFNRIVAPYLEYELPLGI